MDLKIENFANVFANHYEVKINHEKSFTAILNDYQDVTIYFDRDKKGQAILDAIDSKFKDIYIPNEFKAESIGFSMAKTPEQVFKDVQKRLIDTEFKIKQFEFLKERFWANQKYLNLQEASLKKIKATGLDIIEQSEKENLSIYLKDGYGKIQVYDKSISLELRSLPSELAIKILKLCKKFEE